MISIQNKLILWTGRRNCGKTTSVAKLAQKVRDEGFNVCGLLAPGVYSDDKLVGFDVFDLRTEKRAPLARCKTNKSKYGPFNFIEEGLRLGSAALNINATRKADLVIVDEFGKLELKDQGWRKNVDSLLASSEAVILFVVRLELADAVRHLYADYLSRELAATEEDSIDEVIALLKNRRQHVRRQNVEA